MTEPRKSKILKIDFLTKMALVVVYLSYISRLKKNSSVKLLKLQFEISKNVSPPVYNDKTT